MITLSKITQTQKDNTECSLTCLDPCLVHAYVCGMHACVYLFTCVPVHTEAGGLCQVPPSVAPCCGVFLQCVTMHCWAWCNEKLNGQQLDKRDRQDMMTFFFFILKHKAPLVQEFKC